MTMRMLITSVASLLATIALAGCTNSVIDRSLIFTTATTAGIEVSASPSQADSPVKLLVGYKRFEGVLNPVWDADVGRTSTTTGSGDSRTRNTSVSVTDVQKRYRPKAYSVMAKLAAGGNAYANSGAGTEGGVRAEVAQWFATGDAATELARRENIAAALSPSAALQPAPRAEVITGVNQVGILQRMYDITAEVAGATSGYSRETIDRAKAIQASADALASGIPNSFQLYTDNGGTLTITTYTFASTGYQRLFDYEMELEPSQNAIDDAITQGWNYQAPAPAGGGAAPAPVLATDPSVRPQLEAALDQVKATRANIGALLVRQPSVDLINFVNDLMTGKRS